MRVKKKKILRSQKLNVQRVITQDQIWFVRCAGRFFLIKTSEKQFELDEQTILDARDRGKRSLFFFARAILGFDKMTRKIHRPICKKLEDPITNRRMTITLPRDWYKTTLVSIAYPLWRAVNDPEIRILLAQNTYDNAAKKLMSIGNIVKTNQFFRACYPEVLPTSASRWTTDSKCLNRKSAHPESTFEIAGVQTTVVSRHYDLIIEDDTIAPGYDQLTGNLMQPSQADCEKCIGWHKLTIPLLIEPAESQIIVVGTRWVEGDLLGFIKEHESHYTIIERSCLEDEKGESDPAGEPTWTTTDDGRPKFTREILQEIEAALGPYMFAALYLNQPTAAANQLFKPEWINYYETAPKHLLVATAMDPATGDDSASEPDFTVCLTIGINPEKNHIYVLDYTRNHNNPGGVIEDLFTQHRKYKPLQFKLESIAYQRTLAYWIKQKQQKRGIYFDIDEVKHHKASKLDRIKGLQPYFAANNIFIKKHMKELESELKVFPYGKHDDVIDALSMLLPFIIDHVSHDRKVTYKRTYENPFSMNKLLDQVKEHQRNVKDPFHSFGNLRFRLGERNKDRLRSYTDESRKYIA